MNFNRIYRDPVIKKIVWTCTTYCNYNCSYCPSSLHDNKHRWPSNYQSVIDFINTWRKGSPVTLDILGGEPTLWPKFEQFCNDVINSSEHKTKIIFSSNGSRTLNYWRKFNAKVTNLGLSFHPEEADIDHFEAVVEELSNRYNLQIWLMLSYPHLDIVKEMYNRLEKYNIDITVYSVVDFENKTGKITNKAEYQEFSENYSKRVQRNSVVLPYMLYKTDGVTTEPVDEQFLINSNQSAFKGWKCFVGRDTLYIQPNGDIFGSSCGASKCYGNIHNPSEINITAEPVICPYKYCGCGTDVEIEKVNVL